ncbi:hypothetical protein V8C43DRAFT_274283 [Trichoderma afarasin]
MCNAKFGRPINQSCRPKNEQKKMTEETKQNRWVFSCMHWAHEHVQERQRQMSGFGLRLRHGNE